MFGTRIAGCLVLALSVGPAPIQEPGILEIDFEQLLADTGFYDGLARGLVGELPASGRAKDLLLAEIGSPGGVGDDATLRAFVTRFLMEESPRHLFILAHHLRVQTTRRWGTIWTIDGGPLALLHGAAAHNPNPTRRAFALIALQDCRGFRSTKYLTDDEPLVRLAAARVLGAPGGVTEDKAAKVVGALLALLADGRPAFRAAGAGALGPWVFRETDLETLVEAAGADPDPIVRAAAQASLGDVRSLRARARLRGVMLDDAVGAIEREAARNGLARTGIVP